MTLLPILLMSKTLETDDKNVGMAGTIPERIALILQLTARHGDKTQSGTQHSEAQGYQGERV